MSHTHFTIEHKQDRGYWNWGIWLFNEKYELILTFELFEQHISESSHGVIFTIV